MKTRTAVLPAAAVLLLAGCVHPAQPAGPGVARPTASPARTTAASPSPHRPGRCAVDLSIPGRPRPDPSCTPGDVHGTALADICPHVDPALEAARPTQRVKDQVYALYGITSRKPGQYEIDHVVPLELDGANTVNNLWPEPNDHPSSRALNSKDLLENRLHALVCAGTVPLTTAQQAIARDWPAAYVKYLPASG